MSNDKFMGQGPFGLSYYLKGALAGAICCSATHGGVVPVDVVKTKIQLDPVKYKGGMFGVARQIMAAEGAGGLLTGLGPTAQGYFIQGWFKFGGVEYFKIRFGRQYGEQAAWDNRQKIYLMSAAIAETIADCFLCPFEACRIRLVSNPEYANGMLDCAKKMNAEMGFMGAFYSGFIPILCKQIPYTMAKFAVQGKAAEAIYAARGTSPDELTKGQNVVVSLQSGVVAGVVAATISHPADTLLSKINKKGAGGEGGMFTRLGKIAAEEGAYKLCTVGLPARWLMIGSLTAGQFGIFDIIMAATGATKFHFVNPSAAGH
jgi:solute carrier family 25 (mitochondrial phosphate transporter), member 3